MDSEEINPDNFRRGSIRATHPRLTANFDALVAEFPSAQTHRSALQALGADFTDLRRTGGSGGRQEWAGLVRFGEILERALNLNNEVLFIYSTEFDYQRRDFDRIAKTMESRPRRPEGALTFVFANDPRLSEKLHSWSTNSPYPAAAIPILSKNPNFLAAQILSSLQRQIASINLYEERDPVTGADFFGRQRLITDLVGQLKNGRVCGVFGLRKTGKTSLIKELGQRFVSQDSEHRVFALRDLEDLPSNSSRSSVSIQYDLAQALLPDFRRLGLRTQALTALDPDDDLSKFRRAIQSTLSHSKAAHVQVVIALDEIESLIGKNDPRSVDPYVAELFGTLRSLVQENDNFNVLLAGLTTSAMAADVLHGRENPLFNWAIPFYMPPLDPDEASEMVRAIGQRMAIAWEDAALSRLYEATGGNIHLLRSYCARVAERLPSDFSGRIITAEHIQNAFRSWRRGVVEQTHGMLEAFGRYHDNSVTVLRDIGSGDLSAVDAETYHPAEVDYLLRLGLLAESDNSLTLTPFSKMALS